MRTCPICHVEFEIKKVCGKKRKYCSPECSKTANLNKTKESYQPKPYEKRNCLVCGKELPNKKGVRGVKPRHCKGECTLVYKAHRDGDVGVLFGELVIENDEREKCGLYGATVDEMAMHFETSVDKMRIELHQALFKFKAIFEEFYGKPDFEDHFDEWDRLCNYIDYENTQDSAGQ